MKVTITLRLAALLGVVAFAGKAQAQTVPCEATSGSTSTYGNSLYLGASATNPHCDVSSSATAVVPHVLRLTLSDITTPLSNPTADDFDTTAVYSSNPDKWLWSAGPAITAKGNRPFNVYMRADSAKWAYAGDAVYNNLSGAGQKDAADLAYVTVATGPSELTPVTTGFTSIGTTDAQVTALSQLTTGGTKSVRMQYRTAWRYATDVPGTYSLPIVYTIIGQ